MICRTSRVLLSFIAVGCALAWPERGEAQTTTTTDTLSFRDVPGVHVVVEPLDAEMEQFGLFADSLRGLLEAKFSSAGIRLLSEDEWQTTSGNPLAFLDRFFRQPRLIAGWLFAVIRSCGWWPMLSICQSTQSKTIWAINWVGRFCQ